MAGFFGLFGNKAKYIEEVSEQDRQSAPNGEAFYLNTDEAKSFGNLDYMKKPKTIERTFPKTLRSPGGKSIKQISSMEKAQLNGNEATTAASTANDATPLTQAQSERRSADSSMDMFRKMAREIKQ
jgi:hypothetical protein